jgi:hypothetical protein
MLSEYSDDTKETSSFADLIRAAQENKKQG